MIAAELGAYAGRPDVIVLGLPRGGLPVADEVARALGLPLDVFIVRKLGVPGHEELALGAVASGGVVAVNDNVASLFDEPGELLRSIAKREYEEIKRRELLYRGDRLPPDVKGKTVILVDDGLATGSTMLAAIEALRRSGPERIVVAVPVSARGTCQEVGDRVDDLVCAATPQDFYAVGQWYADFGQVTDDEVREILENSKRAGGGGVSSWTVTVRAGELALTGDLTVPEDARGVILFAHGSGSSRHSPRNRFVARAQNDARLATLLIDLLTEEEEETDRETAELRFDIDLLARRLVVVTDWLASEPKVRSLPIGYFGASTGAAAALVAAAQRPSLVFAVVSRGGRPDLAGPALPRVRAPTLLIVGGQDGVVLDLNRQAFEQLRCEEDLVVVPGATHLFEEPGALDAVAHLARRWFERFLLQVEERRPIG